MEEHRLAAGPPPGTQHAAQLEQQQAEGALQEQLSAGRRNTYSDHFMMFTFKVEMCKRVDKHDREQCPYAHPGELARRRHPSLYQALPCPEARAKKICPRLENCNCSHSTFEFWLHPDRYKTFLCERGEGCNRPICFFAHSPTELRELPQGLQRTQPAPRPTTSAAGPAGSSSSSQQAGHGQQGAGGEAASSPVWQAAATGQAAPAGPGSRPNQHQPQLQTRAGEQRRGAQQVPGAQASAPRAGGVPMMMFSPVMPLRPSDSSQAGRGVVRPEGHRGATVAVIPAGPSVWQNNALMLSEAGEAPNLEELCAAVARVSMQQVDPRVDAVALQQYQQAYSQQGMVMQQQQAAVLQLPEVLSAQTPMMVLSPQHMLPPLAAMSGLAAPQLQQQQPGQPLQQQVLLPNGQVVLVQVPPREEGRAADPSPWGAM